jgi:hypothetical protein
MTIATLNFYRPKASIKTVKVAQAIAGSLGKPSKMPGLSYGISATLCKVGSKLAKIKGSVCNGCYALKANYAYESVKKAHANRVEALQNPQWADAMIKLIGSQSKEKYFRFHDSGDLQNLQHLFDIVRIAEALPEIKFWLPTKEKGLINQYMRSFGDFPANLCVRVSAAMVDGKAPAGFDNTSTVFDKGSAIGSECEAYKNQNKCGDCRKCWDRSIKNISYKKH